LLDAFALQLKNLNEDVVVVGHSNTTPALIALLGGPKITIEESDYGTLFILTLSEGNVELETQEVTF
jgi:broad specificity phosphatase PhoE